MAEQFPLSAGVHFLLSSTQAEGTVEERAGNDLVQTQAYHSNHESASVKLTGNRLAKDYYFRERGDDILEGLNGRWSILQDQKSHPRHS